MSTKSRDGSRPDSTLLRKRPHLFATVFGLWGLALAWFHPRLWSLTELADGPWSYASITYFVVFAEIAWLYGLYNLVLVAFAIWHRRGGADRYLAAARSAEAVHGFDAPAVAVLYTTCNDFDAASARSCLALDYPKFTVYLLDDSSDARARARVDAFAEAHLGRVVVVRREDRAGFKAGNLNHALANVAHEPLFAVVDADEILPRDFLSRLVPRMLADPSCGFVQANHRSRRNVQSRLARDMGIGVDIHWKWYQPLRNDYGFVMFLGHGALLRRSCWVEVGGFPHIVSEDLGFAIAIRERGYKGLFAEDVVCLEEFPDDVRAFRVRHVKWTRGTCEFLRQWTWRLLRAPRVTWPEKLDILFPTLNLPLTFFFFLFMINAQLLFPLVLGQFRDLTFVVAGAELTVPVLGLRDGVARIFTTDFFVITLLTIVAPVLCFILDLWRQPQRLLRFLAHSTALYAALSPLTFIAVSGYLATGKARFLVTGDRTEQLPVLARAGFGFDGVRRWLTETHPDARGVRLFEGAMGVVFLGCAVIGAQLGFIGLSLAFLLLPVMHATGWSRRWVRLAVWVPFLVFLSGLMLGVAGVAGLQPVFFGYGFHF